MAHTLRCSCITHAQSTYEIVHSRLSFGLMHAIVLPLPCVPDGVRYVYGFERGRERALMCDDEAENRM